MVVYTRPAISLGGEADRLGDVPEVAMVGADPVMRREIGVRLRRWRLSHGRSQRDLADLVGVTQPTISNYEAGRRDIPFVVAAAVAAEFNTSLDDLARAFFSGVTPGVDNRDDLARVISTLVERPELAAAVASVCEIVDIEARPVSLAATETGRPRGGRRRRRGGARSQPAVA